MMSDNITLVKQRECAVIEGEDEMYIVDIFSCVKPGEHHDYNESHKQLLLYITRAVGNNRSTFLQEEKAKLGMVRVYSDKFCWKKAQRSGTLFAIMEMGDFQAVKTVEKMKIDEMRLPEKVTYTLPPCNASTMKVVTKLLSESLGGNTLLETEQLNVPLSIIPKKEPKPGVEHDYVSSQTTELSLAT